MANEDGEKERTGLWYLAQAFLKASRYDTTKGDVATMPSGRMTVQGTRYPMTARSAMEGLAPPINGPPNFLQRSSSCKHTRPT